MGRRHLACENASSGWQRADAPADAIGQANTLIKQVMHERGYPVGDFDQRAEDISVRHPLVVQHYRAAREVAQRNERGQATTEDLRRALVHYRGLFHELLDEREAEHDARETGETVARGMAQGDGRERGRPEQQLRSLGPGWTRAHLAPYRLGREVRVENE